MMHRATIAPNGDSAVISPDGRYRYMLTRKLGLGAGTCTFVMLNPSTADAFADDPTIRRCKGFAAALGCTELVVVNLFAVRATKPRDMLAASDPVGPGNHEWVTWAVDRARRDPFGDAGHVICAWGAHGNHMGQGETVLGWIEATGARATCLGLTADGNPRHPLYLPADARPVPYLGRRRHAR